MKCQHLLIMVHIALVNDTAHIIFSCPGDKILSKDNIVLFLCVRDKCFFCPRCLNCMRVADRLRVS